MAVRARPGPGLGAGAAGGRRGAAAPAAGVPKASEFDDLREASDEDLDLLSDEYGLSAEQLKRIKSTQLALAKTGKFPAGATA